MSQLLHECARLSDRELLAGIQGLAARERQATAELVAHLAEAETRNLHLAAGYGSLFAYCHEGLRLSEHEAYNRIEAARAVRRFPLALDLLAEGAINLTTVRLLAPHLTSANHVEVLQSARGLRRSQVEEVVARLAPRPDVPVTIRKLPAMQGAVLTPRPDVAPPESAAPMAVTTPLGTGGPAASAPATPRVDSVPLVTPPARAIVSALSPDRYRLQLTIDGELLAKLRQAEDLLRHAIPSGDDAAILDRALTLLLADLAKKKHAASDRPRTSRGVSHGSRHVPAEVRRAAFERDGGRCAFIGVGGRRCGERAFVEFHHVQSYTDNGPPTVNNIELRCRRHNRYEWHQRCGDWFGVDTGSGSGPAPSTRAKSTRPALPPWAGAG
jgi:hypothetical protein